MYLSSSNICITQRVCFQFMQLNTSLHFRGRCSAFMSLHFYDHTTILVTSYFSYFNVVLFLSIENHVSPNLVILISYREKIIILFNINKLFKNPIQLDGKCIGIRAETSVVFQTASKIDFLDINCSHRTATPQT